jgi:uncharacterized protein
MIDHPHAGEEARRIAEAGTLLRTQVGSGVHGTAIPGQDDRDELGICAEPPRFVTGIATVRTPDGRRIPFEQYEVHTAWARPGGLAERSGAGDLDVVIYGARKWTALAAAGNPTVLLPLWVPESEVVVATDAGRELRAHADRFVSRAVAERFLGYLRNQKDAMTAVGGERRARPAHVGKHGYDVKYAMHALRLGVQGAELLSTGRITLPVPGPELSRLREVRSDRWPLADVLTWLAGLEADLTALGGSSDLPPDPDWRWINGWLHRTYLDHWAQYPEDGDGGAAGSGT